MLQGKDLVVNRLKVIKQAVQDSLEDGIEPSLTSDIWTSGNKEAYISFTMHIIDKEMKAKTYSLGAVPMG